MEFEDEHDEEQEEEEDDEDDIIIPPPAIPPSYVDSVIMNSAPHRVNPVSHQPSSEIRRSSSIIPVRYRECLKNHAVGIGGHAVDGCGEFMPAGEDGTLDALKCAACNCHRNFHRKEAASASSDSATPLRGRGERNNSSSLSPGPLSSTGFNAAAFAAASAAANAAAGAGGGVAFPQHQFSAYYRTPAPHPTGYLQHRPAIPALPSSNTSGGTHSGEMGDDMSHPSSSGGGGGGGSGSGMMIMSSGGTSNIKKRHRTKFSQEQKDQMLGFAEKLGWRIQKHDEAAVQQFCAETQVKRQVLKVWMHNNKHTIGKKLP